MTYYEKRELKEWIAAVLTTGLMTAATVVLVYFLAGVI
jgi:hypothetical protein